MLQSPGNVRHVPTATWIPDFQHLHFPEFFTKEDLKTRSRLYADAAFRTQILVLSSEHALHDLRRVAPDAMTKTRVLRFVAQIKSESREIDPSQIANHYHLPQKYFFLPNQLWQHKNHRIVLQALAKVRDRIPEITLDAFPGHIFIRLAHCTSTHKIRVSWPTTWGCYMLRSSRSRPRSRKSGPCRPVCSYREVCTNIRQDN
jgi:hypothetical protein